MSALKKFYVQRVEAPVGLLTIVATEQGVCQIHFGELKKAHVSAKLTRAGIKQNGLNKIRNLRRQQFSN